MLGACRWVTGYYYARAAAITADVADLAAAADLTYYAHAASVDAGAANAANAANAALAANAHYCITDWNDAEGRTMEEVIAALEACP